MQHLRPVHDAITHRKGVNVKSRSACPLSIVVQQRRSGSSYASSERFTVVPENKCDLILPRTAVSSHSWVSSQDPFSDWEVEDMISRCLYVLDLKHKLYGSRYTPWPSRHGSTMDKAEVKERVATAKLDIPNEDLNRLIREILSRDDAVSYFQRAVQLMTAVFWDLDKVEGGYLPWTMTAVPFAYQIKRYGQPMPHYVEFYRIFMNVIGFEDELSFDISGIPKKIATFAKYRTVRALRGIVLTKQTSDSFTPYEILAMKSRCHTLLTDPPGRIVTRKEHSWPSHVPLEQRIFSLTDPFGDSQLHEMLIELLLKPEALSSLQRSVRCVFQMFWSHEQVVECYLPSTCNGLIRKSQLGRKPLPHHETFYSIFMQLFGFPDVESFKDSPEAARVSKFIFHLTQYERSSRLSKLLQRNQHCS